MREAQARRGAIVAGLFAVLFAIRFAFASPTFVGVTFLLVLPTVFAALWFGVRGGLARGAGGRGRVLRGPSGSTRRWTRRSTRCCSRRSCAPWSWRWLGLEAAGAGPPLGLEAELPLSAATAPLPEAGGVLLYTDGIIDARNERSERFGEERLQALVASHPGATATAIVEHLRLALANYAPIGGDDVCLLAARHRAG